jgi:hypothetical protein
MQSLFLFGREKHRRRAFARTPKKELLDGFREENVETILSAEHKSATEFRVTKGGTYVELLDPG